MSRVTAFFRREAVLSIAWILALGSMLLVPPDRTYISYVDFHTLGLLFSLMAVMAGLQSLGLFRCLGEAMLSRTATLRQLEGVLIFLPFFASMAVTNDVALITFVPFALEVLKMAGEERRAVPVVAMQTIAANLGSMTTPIGNPQNLYLYSHYHLTLGVFFSAMLALTLGSAFLLGLFVRLEKSHALTLPAFGHAQLPRDRRLWLYLGLFLFCLGAVAGWLPVWAVTALVLAGVLRADRTILRQVDWSLLLTFVGFFLFVGNLGRLPILHTFFQQVLYHHEVACSILVSQLISNVPAALLLSGFTDNVAGLLVGTNLGGLGTLIASMASLISYKQVARAYPQQRGRYLLWFTAANLIFLAALLGLHSLLG